MNSTLAYVAGGVAAAAVVGPLACCAALPALGFGSGGIVASSAAAGMQASIGNVAAGSAFAVLQSAGAGGVAAGAAVHGAAAAVMAPVGAGAGWLVKNITGRW